MFVNNTNKELFHVATVRLPQIYTQKIFTGHGRSIFIPASRWSQCQIKPRV